MGTDGIIRYSFSGPNAKEDAAKFLAGIDPDTVESIKGIDSQEIAKAVVDHWEMPTIKIQTFKTLIGDISGQKYVNLDGWVFCAKLDIDTPSAFLKSHGEIARNESKKFEDEGFGAWLPISLDDETFTPIVREEVNFAPLFGSAKPRDVIVLLNDARKIIEGDASSADKFTALNALHKGGGKISEIVAMRMDKKGLAGLSTLGELWAFKNLTAVKGIGPAKARKLIEQGVYSASVQQTIN